MAELKPVASLFVQFHGIDYDADRDVASKLQTYFTTAQQAAAQYGGRVNRLLTGDKGSLLHVIFGAPRTIEDQEQRAVRCALDLQAHCGGLPFIHSQRIGIAVGRAFAGPVGSPERHDYTVMGDTINLSARLMQNAGENEILIEAAVRNRLSDAFDVTDKGVIRVKGKTQPIRVFTAIAVNPPQATTANAGDHLLVGRDHELAQLRQRLDALSAGHGGIVLLTGELGMGKTALLAKLRAEVLASDRMAWAGGMGLAYGQALSGYLILDLLRDLLGLPGPTSPAETAQRLSTFCADIFGSMRLPATLPYLARFMGLPLPTEDAQRLEGLSVRVSAGRYSPSSKRYSTSC